MRESFLKLQSKPIYKKLANTRKSHIVMMYKTMNLIHIEIYGQPNAILVVFLHCCAAKTQMSLLNHSVSPEYFC